MVLSGCHYYCFFCLLVCAVFQLVSGTVNCSSNSTRVTCDVEENAANNTLVYDVTDLGYSDTSNLHYQIFLRIDEEKVFFNNFVVDGSVFPRRLPNGQLRTRGDFDRERMFDEAENSRSLITWNIILIVYDPRTGRILVQLDLVINVQDINDNTPTFIKSYALRNSSEGLTITHSLPHAIDADEERNAIQSYTLLDDYDGLFMLWVRLNTVQDTVRLESTAPLDRETRECYDFVVIATDGCNKTGTLNVTLKVLDINDNSPYVPISSYNVEVRENLLPNQPVCDINATDNDLGEFARLTYFLTVNNNEVTGVFSINQSTGEITTSTVLDREHIPNYHLIVTIRDGGNTPLSTVVSVNVRVADVNDNPPVFIPANDTVSLREDYLLLQPFYTATARDADEGDNANSTYSIVSSTNGRFEIDPATGAVSLLSTLDYETVPSILVVIKAVDSGRLDFSSRLYLNISVLNIDEHLPRFESDFPTSLTVNESVPSCFEVLRFQAVVSQTSPANHFNYLLSNHLNDFSLSVSSSNVALLEVVSLDREHVSEYNLTITIVNTVANSRNSKSLIIIISDTNDNSPVFNMSQYFFEVVENSVRAEVGTVTADDDDDGANSMIRYTIQDSSSLFQINPVTGRIQTTTSLDYDTRPEHNLIVLATDMGSPSRSTSATVIISVIDINDNPPQFLPNQKYEFTVNKAATIGMVVTIIKATDVDSGCLTYSIRGGNINNRFRIVQSEQHGVLIVVASLDCESVATTH